MKKNKDFYRENWMKSVAVRDRWKYDFEEDLEFPRIIQFQTHSFCNASCIMCPYPTIQVNNKNGYMTEELIDKIICECKEYNVQEQYEFLPFLMNEPLLDQRLPSIVSKIKKTFKNSAVSIYTNGSCENQKIWSNLVESEPNTIVFSVNSIDKKEYEHITGKLSFDVFEKNIININSSVQTNGKQTEIITHVLRMGKTKDELIEFMKYWQSKGIKCRSAHVENRAGNIDIAKLPLDINHLFVPQKCWRVLSQIHILFDGTVILCCGDWKHKVILGNVLKESIIDIWNKKEYKEIRYNHKFNVIDQIPKLCKTCNMKGFS